MNQSQLKVSWPMKGRVLFRFNNYVINHNSPTGGRRGRRAGCPSDTRRSPDSPWSEGPLWAGDQTQPWRTCLQSASVRCSLFSSSKQSNRRLDRRLKETFRAMSFTFVCWLYGRQGSIPTMFLQFDVLQAYAMMRSSMMTSFTFLEAVWMM